MLTYHLARKDNVNRSRCGEGRGIPSSSFVFVVNQTLVVIEVAMIS